MSSTTDYQKDPSSLTFEEFAKDARALKLSPLHHGRAWKIEWRGRSLGFSDGQTADDAIRDEHRSCVNNALWHYEPDGDGSLRQNELGIDLPPAAVLAQYPELLKKFPGAAKLAAARDKQAAMQTYRVHVHSIIRVEVDGVRADSPQAAALSVAEEIQEFMPGLIDRSSMAQDLGCGGVIRCIDSGDGSTDGFAVDVEGDLEFRKTVHLDWEGNPRRGRLDVQRKANACDNAERFWSELQTNVASTSVAEDIAKAYGADALIEVMNLYQAILREDQTDPPAEHLNTLIEIVD